MGRAAALGWTVMGFCVACGPGPVQQAQVAPCPPGGTDATWENHADAFLTTWCTPCHDRSVVGEARKGAPTGIDFDTYQDAVAWGDRIAARSTGDSPTMPPAAGPSDQARIHLAHWVACGMPGGGPEPSDPCSEPSRPSPGDVVVASAADVDTFCLSYDAVAGDLRVEGGEVVVLDCVCEVSGSVRVEGGAGCERRCSASMRIGEVPSKTSCPVSIQ